jgi:hypothetical protein
MASKHSDIFWVFICISEEMRSDTLGVVTSDTDFSVCKHFHVTTQFALSKNWLTDLWLNISAANHSTLSLKKIATCQSIIG